MQTEAVQHHNPTPQERALIAGLTEEQKIRAVFRALGGRVTIADVLKACIAADVWSPDEYETFARKEAARRVASILRDKRTGRRG